MRGTLYLTVQQSIQYLAAFIFYAGIARFITQTEVGLWSILTASTAVFTTFTLLGLPVATQMSWKTMGEETELLKKALPYQLEKILNVLGNFIVHRTIKSSVMA